MHNDVKQCFRGSNVHCGSSRENEGFIFSWGVVVTNESTWRRIFPKREIYMAVMPTCVLMWLGRRVVARAFCSSFQIGLDPLFLLLFFSTTSTTGRHLGFELPFCLLGSVKSLFIRSFKYIQF